MAKNKSRVDKWEETLEELYNNPELDREIEEIERRIAELRDEKAEQYNSLQGELDNMDYNDMYLGTERYQEVQQEFNDVDKEKKDNESIIEGLNKKLSIYKAFKDNSKQIFNIREYQLLNQEKLQGLESKREEVSSSLDELIVKREEIKKDGKRINDDKRNITKRQTELEEIMSRKDLSQEEREELREKLNKLSDDMDKNYKESNEYLQIKSSIDKEIKQTRANLQKIDKQIDSMCVTISKCNVIWSCLIKGKNWDEIETIIQSKDFTAEKGTLHRIRELKKRETAIVATKEDQPVIEEKESPVETEEINEQDENQQQEKAEIEPIQGEEESGENKTTDEESKSDEFSELDELLSIFGSKNMEEKQPDQPEEQLGEYQFAYKEENPIEQGIFETAQTKEERLESVSRKNLPVLSFKEQINVFENVIKEARKNKISRNETIKFIKTDHAFGYDNGVILKKIIDEHHLTQMIDLKSEEEIDSICEVLEINGKIKKIENSKIHRIFSRLPLLNRIPQRKIDMLESRIDEICFEEEGRQIASETVQGIMQEFGKEEYVEENAKQETIEPEKSEPENVVPDVSEILQYFNKESEEPKNMEEEVKQENVEPEKSEPENVVPDVLEIFQDFNIEAEEPKDMKEEAEQENIQETKIDAGLLDEIDSKKKRSIKRYCRIWS